MKTHSLRGFALRLRVPLSIVGPGTCTVGAETVTYVTRVHRIGPGGRFVAFDPERAVEADAELIEVTRSSAVVRIEEIRPATLRPERQVTLIQCVGKGEKMDAIVRDATELGATRIVPAIAERTIPRPDAARAERWRRIAVEAARQCGRGDAPAIDPPVKLLSALTKLSPREGEVAFCLDPSARTQLGPAITALPSGVGVVLVVGPEGGLEQPELVAAERAGFAHVTIGPLILRTETVCAAVLGALLISAPPPKS
jgi:16S rRNA (uracil1498-N3)-methyltransferase